MDISTTTQADSTQINADDLIASSIVVTITDVTKGTSEQPVNIHVAELPDKAYRPSKSMRRVLVEAWGADSSVYIGRRLELYRDPDVRFGPAVVGGVKIRAMSNIDGQMSISLTASRGKRAPHLVEPLTESPAPAFDIDSCDSIPTLRKAWKTADADGKKAIESRVKQLEAEALGEQSDGGA